MTLKYIIVISNLRFDLLQFSPLKPLTESLGAKARLALCRWLGGLLVERRTSVSQIRGSIPRQVAAV